MNILKPLNCIRQMNELYGSESYLNKAVILKNLKMSAIQLVQKTS